MLDSQWVDKAGREKSKILIEQGETVFIWPKALGEKYKDFNDVAAALNIKQIDPGFIIKNACKGMQAFLKLAEIKR